MYGSPALFSAPIGDANETVNRRLSYRWGVGAGYLWRRDRFAAALGLGLSHSPLQVNASGPRCTAVPCLSANDLLLDLELRLGGGSRRLFGYGLFAPGLALGASQIGPIRYIVPGFGLDFGAGVWGLAWRGLFVGGEALISPSVYGPSAPAFHSGATSVGLALRLLVGWHFGWR